MDADMYNDSVEYEKLTQTIYKMILAKEGVNNITVEHNVNLEGRSGVAHQIDVLWRFKQAGVNHTVLIECKNYSTALTLEKVRNFFAVLHDIGNAKGLMVTKVGYQSGVVKFADHYGIDLKLLRKPTKDDWEGRIKDIHVNITAKVPASTEEHPIRVTLFLQSSSEEQKYRLDNLIEKNALDVPSGPDLRFLDKEGVPCTDEMRWWLPRELNALDKEPGGPYEQAIELDDKYVLVNLGQVGEELVKVSGIKVIYNVKCFQMPEIISHGEDVVAAILKDFGTGEVEHVHRKG